MSFLFLSACTSFEKKEEIASVVEKEEAPKERSGSEKLSLLPKPYSLENQGISLAEGPLPLYEEPDRSSRIIGEIPPLTSVNLEQESGTQEKIGSFYDSWFFLEATNQKGGGQSSGWTPAIGIGFFPLLGRIIPSESTPALVFEKADTLSPPLRFLENPTEVEILEFITPVKGENFFKVKTGAYEENTGWMVQEDLAEIHPGYRRVKEICKNYFLHPFGSSLEEILTNLGPPVSRKKEEVENPHDSKVKDTIHVLEYPSFTVEIYTPTQSGKEFILRLTIHSNSGVRARWGLLPGVEKEYLLSVLGKPYGRGGRRAAKEGELVYPESLFLHQGAGKYVIFQCRGEKVKNIVIEQALF